MAQEALLPGTKAITKSTAEWSIYRDQHLVRLKLADGTTWQKKFARDAAGQDEAARYFYGECVPRLREEAKGLKD